MTTKPKKRTKRKSIRYRFDLSDYAISPRIPFYDEEVSDAMAKTFRGSGSVGGTRAKIPKYVAYIASPEDTILDYGAGNTIPHTRWLRSLGLTVVAVDQKFNPSVHDKDAFKRKYDIIMCSNVLNVQPQPEHIVGIIYHIKTLLKPGGLLVINYPDSPRYFPDVTDTDIEQVLRLFFRHVSKTDIKRYLGGYPHAWVCIR